MHVLKAPEEPAEPKKGYLQAFHLTNTKRNRNNSHFEQPQKQRSDQSQPCLSEDAGVPFQLAGKPTANGETRDVPIVRVHPFRARRFPMPRVRRTDYRGRFLR